LCDSIGHQRCLRVSLANLGHIHLLKKEYEKVIPYKLRAIAIQKNTGNVQQISENLDQLCEAYVAIGDYSAAYEYRLELDSIIASEYEQNLDALTNELQIKYETGKNHERLTNLSERLRLQRIALLLGGAILLLSVIGIILFRSLNKKLKIKNKENEILLKEIHHRVKNNLQILSSLLSLQSDSLDNENAIDALSESRNRVESMGLIHQRLYTNDDITSVNIKTYISDLCRYLEDSFSSEDRSFKIVENVTYESIDVDYAIPLGLIINELVTNATKYAFKDRSDGILHLQLSESANGLELVVSDNGHANDISNNLPIKESFGSQLIRTLSKKMKGVISIDTDNGYKTKITFKRYATVIIN
jgi:two-component sensor histidine kinase